MLSDLPGLAEALRPHTGGVVRIEPTEHGSSSDVTAIVSGDEGRWFVKAVRNRAGGRRDSLVREGRINPHVQPVSPPVRWRTEDADWLALGFEVVHGRHADLAPGSADVSVVVDVLNRIAAIPLPEVAADWPETRWDRYADGPGLFRGGALLYTDVHPSNILVGEENVWAVDWAWPTRGAAWIDAALLVLQLIAAGHAPVDAEAWAAGCTTWRGADPEAVDAFAAANARMYEAFAARSPDASWLGAMAAAARAWTAHRSR